MTSNQQTGQGGQGDRSSSATITVALDLRQVPKSAQGPELQQQIKEAKEAKAAIANVPAADADRMIAAAQASKNKRGQGSS